MNTDGNIAALRKYEEEQGRTELLQDRITNSNRYLRLAAIEAIEDYKSAMKNDSAEMGFDDEWWTETLLDDLELGGN